MRLAVRRERDAEQPAQRRHRVLLAPLRGEGNGV
jgi:hypothetical protein